MRHGEKNVRLHALHRFLVLRGKGGDEIRSGTVQLLHVKNSGLTVGRRYEENEGWELLKDLLYKSLLPSSCEMVPFRFSWS